MRHGARFILVSLALAMAAASQAQMEFAPPSGKGRAVVAVSGALGAHAYEPAAKKIAAMGYDVFLLNGNDMVGDKGVGLKAAIDKALQSPNALPGKVGAVGFSLEVDRCLGMPPPGLTRSRSWSLCIR